MVEAVSKTVYITKQGKEFPTWESATRDEVIEELRSSTKLSSLQPKTLGSITFSDIYAWIAHNRHVLFEILKPFN